MQDYYRDLDVEPLASFEQIKAAYRRKALRHHPDRGGSHSAMVIVNEAWEVLSSPELRRQYDQQRQTGDAEQASFEEARQRSRNYERNWSKFDSWLSSISRDFDSAQFGSKSVFGMAMPTASKSVSAWVFLMTGGFFGFLIWLAPFVSITNAWGPSSRMYDSPIGRIEMRDNGNTNPIYIRIVFFSSVALVAAGAWGGKWTHEKFGVRIAGWLPSEMPFPFFGGSPVALNARSSQADDSQPKPNEKSSVAHCPECSQKLRIPPSAKTVTITCPKCRTRFDFPTTTEQRKKNIMKFPPNKPALATMLRFLLIFEIVFMVILLGVALPMSAMGEQTLVQAGLVSPEVSVVAVAFFAVAFVVLLPMGIASWVGLFQHKNWGRWLYLISLIVGHLLSVFMGCFSWTYTWDLVSALGSIGYLNNGLIVAICFLSPLATVFEQSDNIESS